MQEVVKAKILKLLDNEIIYHKSDSQWVSPVHAIPKNFDFTVVENKKNELVQTRLPTKVRVCIDYRKLNVVTLKDHFPLPFIEQMLKRLVGHEYYCFLNGYSRYNQIPIAPEDQEKTMFTYLFRTFANHRMPFGLCNAPAMFQQRSNIAWWVYFSYMVEFFHEWFLYLWRFYAFTTSNLFFNVALKRIWHLTERSFIL